MISWLESLPLLWAILFFWAVGVVRTSIVYGMGRAAAAGGHRAAAVRQITASPALRRAEGLVNRWGVLAVPACFLTVGLQTAVIVTTGLTRMPLRRWVPAMAVGTFLWGCIYGTVGLAVVHAWLRQPLVTAAAVVGAVVLVLVLRRCSRSSVRSPTGRPAADQSPVSRGT